MKEPMHQVVYAVWFLLYGAQYQAKLTYGDRSQNSRYLDKGVSSEKEVCPDWLIRVHNNMLYNIFKTCRVKYHYKQWLGLGKQNGDALIFMNFKESSGIARTGDLISSEKFFPLMKSREPSVLTRTVIKKNTV